MPRPIHPPTKNPFRDNTLLAGVFDSTVRAYRERANSLFTADGKPHRATEVGTAFWKGFDGVAVRPSCAEGTIAFACYSAGRAMAEVSQRKHPPARKLPPRY